MSDRVRMPLKAGTPCPKRRVGQGKTGLLSHEGLQGSDGTREVAVILELFCSGVSFITHHGWSL